MKTMPTAKIVHDKIKVKNGELYFERFGEGEPIVLIHNGFYDCRDWKYQINDLKKKYTAVIYDQRGFGNSSIIETPFSPTDDLKSLIDHLNITKTALVGHSLGGVIALDFALKYPDKISALVLIASGLNGYTWSAEYLEWVNSIWNSQDPEKMADQALLAPFYDIAMNNPTIKSELRTVTRENFQKLLTWKTFDMNDINWFFPNAESKLNTLTVPTLVIYGDQDSEDIKKIAIKLKNNIKNVKVMEMKNVDHLLNFEKPTELNGLILEFLDENIKND